LNAQHRKSAAPRAALQQLALCLALAGSGVLLSAPVLAATTAKQASAPAAPVAPKRYTIEQFMATTNIGGASFSADEKRILFHSNKTGIFNVYSISVSGGEPVALTSSTKDSHYAVSLLTPTEI